jgi:hypothetical protein
MFSFIETKLFTRLVQEYLTDDAYRELQTVLIEQPEAGDVIPGSAACGSSAGVRPAGGSAAGIG